jgi:hypothetical protein
VGEEKVLFEEFEMEGERDGRRNSGEGGMQGRDAVGENDDERELALD